MNTLKILYNDKSDFIVPIIEKFNKRFYLEFYNSDHSKSRSTIRKMQEDFGSKNFPLIVIQDENLSYIDAIWSESNPNWESEISKRCE